MCDHPTETLDTCQDISIPRPLVRPVALPREGEALPESEGDERSESLLYLSSNKCIEEYHKKLEIEKLKASVGILQPYQKRQAHTLYLNADRFVSLAPSLDHVGFLTITTPDNCTDYSELQKRWHSFNTNYLKKSSDFVHYLGIKERQQRGALHFHLLVHVAQDIRTGFDWDSHLEAYRLKKEGKLWRATANKAYRTATPYLRSLWADLRDVLPRYKFGRSELLPIRTTVQAVSRYVGAYLGKHLSHREEWDRGMRLMFADQGWIKHSCKFQWNTPGSKEWREKLAIFGLIIRCGDMTQIKEKFGPRWAYKYQHAIHDIKETWANMDQAPF